jgi:hypothetical protein
MTHTTFGLAAARTATRSVPVSRQTKREPVAANEAGPKGPGYHSATGPVAEPYKNALVANPSNLTRKEPRLPRRGTDEANQ